MSDTNETIPQDVHTPDAQPDTPKSVELDGMSEFSFGGEKYTPDRLQEVLSQYKTLETQSKEFQESKKFEDNLEADIDKVLENPNLVHQFKQIYPKKYHSYIDRLVKNSAPQSAQGSNSQPAQVPKEFLQTVDDVKFLKDHIFQTQVEAANAKIDTIVKPLFDKYPMAIEDQVYAKAESVLAKGQKLTEAAWERLVRESHEGISKKADQFYAAKMKSQIEKGKQGKDTGSGGANPGQAPVKPKNFDDAYDAMMKHVRTR